MTTRLFIVAILFSSIAIGSCKKDKKDECNDSPTIRQVTNKKATVHLTATFTGPVYLVEEGTIDTQLFPCSIPLEFQQEGLEVTISGKVKNMPPPHMAPCCSERIVLTAISR